MALSINQAVNAFRLAAGEPIFFSYQPQSAAGVAEALTGRKFVFAIYDSVRADRGTYEAETVTTSDPAAVWRLPGTVSEKLLGSTDLQWEISERLDDSRDQIATGTLTIDMSAPSILDYNNAPISRYITRITRLNDPATVDNPVFKVVIRAYTASASVTAPTFSTTPSISPTSGNVGATYTATDGTVANGSLTSRRWLLGGVSIGTGSTVTPTSAGTLTLENTATGTNGSVITSLSSAVTVSAVTVSAPAFTSQPSISPTSGNVGATYTATDGTVSNGSFTSRRWLLNGSSIGTASTVVPSSAGTLTLENTATGSNGSTIVATSSAVTVTAIATPTLALSPSTATIAENASAGTLIAAVANVPSSVTPTVTPNDGRLVIAGDATNGWKVVTGMSALSAGTVNFTVAATGANSATGALTVTAVATTPTTSNLRVVTTNNRLSCAGYGGTKGRLVMPNTNFAFQTLHVLSTPATEYRMMVMGAWFVTNTGEANLPNTYTIDKMAVSDNTTQTPITFNGGSRSLTVGYSDYYLSDPFTLSTAAGTRLKIKGQGYVSTTGDSVPQAIPAWSNSSDTNAYNARFYTYDPAVGTVDIDVNSGYVVKPSGATAQKYSIPTILVGAPSASSLALGIFGDSLTFGYNEDIIVGVSAYTQPNLGMGPYARGTAATDGVSNSIPSILCGVHSEFGTNFMNAGDRRKSVLPFVNGVHIGYGTNDLGTTGSGSVTGIQNMISTIATQARAVPSVTKVWASNLQPQTTSTDSWATVANQTPRTGWEAGGKRDQINAWLSTQVGGVLTGVADVATAVSDSTRPEAWKATGTAKQWTDEGQHWGNNSQTAYSQSSIAAALRALWV